jgi:hypothetical protein
MSLKRGKPRDNEEDEGERLRVADCKWTTDGLPSCYLDEKGVPTPFERGTGVPFSRLMLVHSYTYFRLSIRFRDPVVLFHDLDLLVEDRAWPWADELIVVGPKSLLGTVWKELPGFEQRVAEEGGIASFWTHDSDGNFAVPYAYVEEDDEEDDEEDREELSPAPAADTVRMSKEYPKPRPFGSFDVPEFPITCVPPVLQGIINAVAEFTQFTVTGVATLVMTIFSACLMTRLEIRPKPGVEYSEPSNQYSIIAGPSAAGKTPAFALLYPALQRAEQAMQRAASLARELAAEELAVLQKTIDDLKSNGLEEIDGTEITKALNRREELAAILKRQGNFLSQDMTPEALSQELANEGFTFMFVDELHLPTFLGSRWGGDPNIALLLQAYSGSPFRSHRKTTGNLQIERPLLAIAAGVQPHVVGKLLGTEEVVTRGLAGRLLIVFAGDRFGERTYHTDVDITSHLENYERLVMQLTALPSHKGRGPCIEFSEEAFQLQAAYFEEVDREMARRRESDLVSFLGKVVGNTARIAGILHAVEHAESGAGLQIPISAKTVESAIAISRFFTAHAERAHGEIKLREDVQRALWARILRESLSEFSGNELFGFMKGTRFIKRAADMQGPLAGLVGRGFIIPLPEDEREGQPGRRPSPRYVVNPRALELELELEGRTS